MAASPGQAFVLEERLQECQKTYKLNVGYAGLPRLPAGFVQMVLTYNPNITELDLSSNNLTDLPEDLGDLMHIRVLRIKYNQLSRLPAAVARLPGIVTLELSGNQISKLDSYVAKMTPLRELDLSGNLLTELPTSLATLPKLEVLRLENNRLESLPANFGELQSLVKLDVSTNCLRQLPASMGRLKRIQRIDAANNLLKRVPPSMGHLKSVKELNLKYNSLDDRYQAKTEEGLSRLLAFLREEEERERLEEIERLRPTGTAVGHYNEYRCKAEPNQLLKTEFGEFNVDNRCWMRTGCSLTQVNSVVYVFGGQLLKDGSVSNELYWMTSERLEWHLQPTRGDRPVGRHGHVAVYDPDHHQLVVFGGRNADKRRLGDVAVLDLDSFTWRRPAVSGATPSPREGAAAAYHAGHMVLFGGHASSGRTNDLLLLELSGWTWTQVSTTGTAPSPRSGAAMCIGHGRYLVMHGGRNNFVLDTAHVLDLMTRTWIEVAPVGVSPPPRHGHQLHVQNDQLFFFGGYNDLGVATCTLLKAVLARHAVDRACALAGAAAFGEPPGEAGLDDGTQQQRQQHQQHHSAAGGAEGRPEALSTSSSSAAVLQLEWQELDADLPYNKSRATVLQNGQMRCYQIGSATLGRSVNEDDAEKGLAFWDVYKIARLDVFKTISRNASANEGGDSSAQRSTAASSKASRIQHTTHSSSKLPATFTSNGPKEQQLLAYLADWQKIFQELYPHRRPMPLTPSNECGVPKFICSTLRPSLPPCSELYSLEPCAKFVCEFLTYEPLANPLHPPTHLPSPAAVLAWQTADAFDASMVLCSLLLGAGYNAYVVMGYAPLAVTLNDLSQVDCPLLAIQQHGCWWTTPAGAAAPATAAAGSSSAASTVGGTAKASAAGSSSSTSGSTSGSSSGSTAGDPSKTAGPGGPGAGAGQSASGSAGASTGSTVGAVTTSSSSSSKPGSGATPLEEPGKHKKYHIRPKPDLLHAFLQQPAQEGVRFGSEIGSTARDSSAGAAMASTGLGSPYQTAADCNTESSIQPATQQQQQQDRQQPEPAAGPEQQPDVISTKLVHAWVLVLPDKREVTKPLFVEASTGTIINPAGPDCPYTGVELIWNASNAWVCMQAPEPHSDSRAVPAAINWDLGNAAAWEAVLDMHQSRPGCMETGQDSRGCANLTGATTRAAVTASMASASLGASGIVAGRPHTPTMSTLNLPRAGTSAVGAVFAPSSGGIAAQLSRVASKAQLGSGTGLGATATATSTSQQPGTPGRPDSSSRAPGGSSGSEPLPAAAAGPGLALSVVNGHTGRGPLSEYARSEYARSEAGDGSTLGCPNDEPGPECHLLPDLPQSWVPKLAVGRDMIDMRCPRGSRTTVYKRCTHDIFATFGECARWDGLVERLTKFTDDSRHMVEEVIEKFARRRDKLIERRTLPQQHIVQESFDHGSLFSVKELRIIRGERRDITFYAEARLDGLMRREEVFALKLTEYFSGRDDHLTYRSATFGAAAAGGLTDDAAAGGSPNGHGGAGAQAEGMIPPQPLQSAAGYGVPGSQQQQQSQVRALPVLKIAQKFSRNPAKPADQDVAKQVFHIAAGKMMVQFHHADDRLVAGHLVFHSDGPVQAVQVDPLAAHPSSRKLLEMYRTLQAKEKDVLQAVHDSEWEGREIARTRNNQEQGISLTTSYYDICRVQAADSDDEPADSEATAHDYLLPFLPPGMALAGGAGSLTREQGLSVRERCMRALKDRLIERANIIQARLDEEQAALARRQASYARDHDSLTPEDEDAFERGVEEAAFKTSILQKRLARHEETALQQYYLLDKQLKADARLSMLQKPLL